MTSIIKQYLFSTLASGQIFKHKGVRWIVVKGAKYNAVRFENQDVKALFHGACPVEIEQSLSSEEWNLIGDEEVLRSIEGV